MIEPPLFQIHTAERGMFWPTSDFSAAAIRAEHDLEVAQIHHEAMARVETRRRREHTAG